MNRDPRGFYAALQVAPDATRAEIQRSFRALMRRRHPDVEAAATAASGTVPGAASGVATGAGAVPDGAEEVRRILESYAVLRYPKSRAEYDPYARPTGRGDNAPAGRDIPVRHHRGEEPVLRVTPVRWERGPE